MFAPNFDPLNPAEPAPAAARVRFVKKRLSKLTSIFDSTFVPTWLHFGTQNLSKSDKTRANMGENGQRWLQMGQDGAKMGQDGAKLGQVGPKLGS